MKKKHRRVATTPGHWQSWGAEPQLVTETVTMTGSSSLSATGSDEKGVFKIDTVSPLIESEFFKIHFQPLKNGLYDDRSFIVLTESYDTRTAGRCGACTCGAPGANVWAYYLTRYAEA
jgi:hypothetical protein